MQIDWRQLRRLLERPLHRRALRAERLAPLREALRRAQLRGARLVARALGAPVESQVLANTY